MQAKFFGRMLTGEASVEEHLRVHRHRQGGRRFRARGHPEFPHADGVAVVVAGLPQPVAHSDPSTADGIVFQLVEWAKGRALSDRTYLVGQQAGLLLLVLLMGVALFNDLSNLNY